jgi:hypothetical protein
MKSFLDNFRSELATELTTRNGQLYIFGTLLSSLSFIFSIKLAIDKLIKKEKVNIELIISNFMLSIGLMFQLFYLWEKKISVIVVCIYSLGFLTNAILLLLAFIKNN